MSLRTPASEVRIAKNVAYKIIAKKGLRVVIGLMIFAAIVYAIIASTMTRYVATNLGSMKIVSTNFPGGHAVPGTQLLIDSTGDFDNKPWTNLFMAIAPHPSTMKVEIVAGPYGTQDWDKYGIEGTSEDKLNNEYIFECLEGCDPDGNKFGIMSPSWIMGVPVLEGN